MERGLQEITAPDGVAREHNTNAAFPRIRHCMFIDHGVDDAAIMVAGRKYFEVEGKDLTREQFMVAVSYLDGFHTIEDIATAMQLSVSSVAALLSSLDDLGVLEQPERVGSLAVVQFVDLVQSICKEWRRQISNHQLFRGLEEQSFRKEVFLGLIIETYHYVKSAPRHIATAIAHCNDEQFESSLIDYFVEEHAHSDRVLITAEKMGISRQSIEQSYPISGTIAVTQMLCDIARKDTLAYMACSALLEMPAEQYGPATESIQEICESYGYAREVLDSFISHAGEDVSAGHCNLLAVNLQQRATVTLEQVHTVVRYLHDLKHSFEQYYDHLIKYYSNIANHIPRQPVNFFSV